MTAFIALALIWGLALSIFLRGRLGPSVSGWPRTIAARTVALACAKPWLSRHDLGCTAS